MNDSITRREALCRIGLLAGSALSASTVSAILAGCRAERPGYGYAFQVLDREQQDLTATLVDLIIPETDTPGARAAGVPEFIDRLLAEWMSEDEQEYFLGGLSELDARAVRDSGRAFPDLEHDEQIAFLGVLDRESYNEERYFGPPPTFFGHLKDLTIAGYYTSEVGATQELRWLAVPGRYDADIPFKDIGRTWAG